MTDTMTEEALFELLSLECGTDADGSVYYCNAQGQLHRVYGPAVERPNGYRAWYQGGRLHRLDGPAIVNADGYRAWWQNGRLHRVDGPAIEYEDGYREWYIKGLIQPKMNGNKQSVWGMYDRGTDRSGVI